MRCRHIAVLAELLPESLGFVGGNRLEQDADGLGDLDTVADDLCGFVGALVGELPGFVALDVLVTELGEFGRCTTNAAQIVVVDARAGRRDGVLNALVDFGRDVGVWRALVVAVGKQQRAVPEVANRSYQLAVDLLLEGIPREVDVLLKTARGRQVVSQQVRMEPFL